MEKHEVFPLILEKYRLQDPWLSPKPWESIASESGASQPRSSSAAGTELRADEVSETILVRLALSALQGSESALADIETISSKFNVTPADMSVHRIPSLWCRSVSTKALGEILKSISHYGAVCCCLHKFVNYFIGGSFNFQEETRKDKESNTENVSGSHPPYSLINYGFSVGVNVVLQGYVCAINTLHASISLRRSSNNKKLVQDATEKGCLASIVVPHDITLLEVYLHTEELRTHIEALGTICMLKSAQPAFLQFLDEQKDGNTIGLEFVSFPRGANLLTYLYKRLQDTDPVHEVLLKFLFCHSLDPYYRLIRSWIYQAAIIDPYKEFIVECLNNSVRDSHGVAACHIRSTLPSYEIHEGVAVPCFLKDVCGFIFRTGQQLQVLTQMLEFFDYQFTGINSCSEVPRPHSGLSNLEVMLPFWNCSSHELFYSTLSFSKRSIQDLVAKRKAMYRLMEEQLHNFFLQLNTRSRKMTHSMPSCGNIHVHLDTRVSGGNIVSSSLPMEVATNNLSGSGGATTLVVDHEEGSGSFSSSEILGSEMDLLDDDSEYSEGSSLHNYEEKYSDMRPAGNVFETVSVPVDCEKIVINESSQSKRLRPFGGTDFPLLLDKKLGDMQSDTMLSNLTNKIPVPEHTAAPKVLHVPASSDDDIQCCKIWPLGGLLRNPFLADNFQEVMGESHTDSKGFAASFEASDTRPLGVSLAYNVLSINPMLARHDWLQMTRNWSHFNRLPYYDFSSIQDPSSAKGDNQPVSTSEIGCEIAWAGMGVRQCVSSALGEKKQTKDLLHCDGPQSNGFSISAANEAQLASSPIHSGGTSTSDLLKEGSLGCISGGAQWETMLKNSDKNCKHGSVYCDHKLVDNSEIPLEVVIDSCIVQEIFLQYKYISSFSVRLLEEGFDLDENLLALRRYHFMEAADWADTFLISLSRHKAYSDPNHSISVVQGILDSALQSSSCERDKYKERLFIYKKEQTIAPSTLSCGTHIYDFVALGYKVDWPVSIVLTPEALKIYASIFGFLFKIKLAVSSLLDIWFFLKDLKQIPKSGVAGQELGCLNILFQLRQQLNHFLVTLQLYMQSQLLHDAWWRFRQNLEYKVKDLWDLESVHMTYLSEVLEICFRGTEMQPVANIIDNILECAVSFLSCFTRGDQSFQVERSSFLDLFARVNFSQVLVIKTTFEKSMKDLHSCYLRYERSREFGLYLFWEYLNYNEYFSNMTGGRS